jgi:hypothetical protein
MIWLVGVKYNSLEWPNGLARASRQSVRVAVRIPMNTRVAILGVNLLPSLRRTQFLCRSCVVFFFTAITITQGQPEAGGLKKLDFGVG